jgi:polyisoprenoid-binding protein YceI
VETTPETPAAPTVTDDRATAEGQAPAAESAQGRTFTIVSDESSASYTVQEQFLAGAASALGIDAGETATVGTTPEVSGQMTLDLSGDRPQLINGDFTVDISRLSSNDSRRDQRIRERWLQSAQFPMARFAARAIEGFPENYEEGSEASFQLLGDLTIREMTQPVAFDVSATLQGDTIEGTGATDIQMTDYGFEPPAILNILTVSNDVTVTVDFVARAQ